MGPEDKVIVLWDTPFSDLIYMIKKRHFLFVDGSLSIQQHIQYTKNKTRHPNDTTFTMDNTA